MANPVEAGGRPIEFFDLPRELTRFGRTEVAEEP